MQTPDPEAAVAEEILNRYGMPLTQEAYLNFLRLAFSAGRAWAAEQAWKTAVNIAKRAASAPTA